MYVFREDFYEKIDFTAKEKIKNARKENVYLYNASFSNTLSEDDKRELDIRSF